jgi:predicted MFS family arabinose efflux permease
MPHSVSARTPRHISQPILVALALSLGAAIALGIARFSYGLLLPPMRADLQWSYLLAGAMGTANAPALIRSFRVDALFVRSALVLAVLMVSAGWMETNVLLFTQRIACGIASAWVFIAGGVLIARVAVAQPARSGLILGLFYGGTGLGIVGSALLVPTALSYFHTMQHSWQMAWIGLGIVCLPAAVLMAWACRQPEVAAAQNNTASAVSGTHQVRISSLGFALAGYFMFGVGYIGYMTFAVALLKEQGKSPAIVTAYFTMLGVAVMCAPFIWAKMLDRFKGGLPMAVLNALAALACALLLISPRLPVVFASGLLFGAVFLAVVSSTTVLVKHNLPTSSWPAGIAAFTTIFAFGQIVGPTIAGWISDGASGLARGIAFSGAALLLGAAFALLQRPLVRNVNKRI